jgi:hypothetical protein
MAMTRTQRTRVEKKQCTRCKRRKPAEIDFYRDKTAKDGRSPWCKACTKDYDRAYRERKRGEAKS